MRRAASFLAPPRGRLTHVAALSVALAMLGAGCATTPPLPPSAPPPADAGDVAFEPVTVSLYPYARESARLVIRNAGDWEALLRRDDQPNRPAPEAPAVFTREMLLVVAMGERKSGGYQIEITAVHRTAAGLRVDVESTKPGPGCMVIQSLSRPVAVVRLPRVNGTIEWVEHEKEAPC